ncbi:hypothetical protein [Candidatus Harpocratesius sp.]
MNLHYHIRKRKKSATITAFTIIKERVFYFWQLIFNRKTNRAVFLPLFGSYGELMQFCKNENIKYLKKAGLYHE